MVDDRATVDRQRHRSALIHVRDLLEVEADVVRGELRALVVVGLALEARNVGRTEHLGGERVDATCLERLHRSRPARDDRQLDVLDRYAARVAPAGPPGQVDLGVVPPADEAECSVGDDVRGLRPLVPPPLDRGARDREEDVVREQVRQPGLGLLEGDADRVPVERLYPDPVPQAGTVPLAHVVGKGALDPVHDVGVGRGQTRVELALPRVFEVARRHRVAVRPAPVVAEADRIDLPAATHGPAGGEVGNRPQVLPTQYDERIHDALGQLRRDRVRPELGIERGWLGPDGDPDRPRVEH